MEQYRTEEEQVEALKKWWDENGRSTIIAIIIALGLGFGWQGWQKHQEQQAAAASDSYQALLQQLTVSESGADTAALVRLAEEIKAEYPRSTYAQFAALHLARLAVIESDLAKAEAFYQSLLGVPPSKRRPGYAKFEPTEPSVNLTLNETPDAPPPVPFPAHYGIQLKSSGAVEAAAARLESQGIAVKREGGTTCCYAVQDKFWVTDPDGNHWEFFVVLDCLSVYFVSH